MVRKDTGALYWKWSGSNKGDQAFASCTR